MVKNSTSHILGARPGERAANEGGPQDRIPAQLLSYGAGWHWDSLGSSMVAIGQLTLTLHLMGLPTSLSPNRTALLQARPRLLLPVQSLVCLAAFGLALPLAISLFPQMSEVSGGRDPRTRWGGLRFGGL